MEGIYFFVTLYAVAFCSVNVAVAMLLLLKSLLRQSFLPLFLSDAGVNYWYRFLEVDYLLSVSISLFIVTPDNILSWWHLYCEVVLN
ncbi:MAG: hypothetical protein KME32_14690 [Mojavia pulchra JT2-VF2]|uniref:Uncharacterized protein n=1 Tax=Mojavia pulchra JT2-VF2 TaxID=287848 RepID=A0A951UGI9_9NOST|nr:hypothetical protein [Mojavia pulchra JT2-VF2]